MSLKEAAKYLETQGRGNDSRLMHVTPSEIQGLQALAMAKGGSLTINPQTGLPEAGFLEDVLPVAAAGALMFMAPPLAGAIGGAFGASGALATGIGAGLLAGGSSLLTQALSGQPINIGKAATTGALTGLTAGALAPSTAVATEVPALTAASQTPMVTASEIAPTITNPDIISGGAQNVFAYTPSGEMVPANYPASVTGANNLPFTSPSVASKPWTGNEKLMAGLGGTAALALLGNSDQQKITTPPTQSYIRPYTYAQTRNPYYGQPGQSYYKQSYTAQPVYQAAQGGLMGAEGPVERMSRENIGEDVFPMSMINNAIYAKSSQMPTSAEVVASDYGQKTNPYNGNPIGMADGGTASSGYIPTSQAVQDYNKMLSDRAVEEYLRNPMPSALMPASQRPALTPIADTPKTPDISQDINGLYQYYLGRQPSESEVGQWANSINGPITPDMANYFSQFTGAELAKTGYKPQGPNPFLGQAGLPMGGPMGAPMNDSLAAQAGLPQFSYDANTRRYRTLPQQQMTSFVQEPVAAPTYDPSGYGAAGGMMPSDLRFAQGGQAGYNLGGYSDGGRLLKGPGDGMSDNIPASIGDKQPARLADGEFVVPADVVSHLGNGSTDAGAKKLYAMMDNVRTARVGTKKQGKQIKSEKYLPK